MAPSTTSPVRCAWLPWTPWRRPLQGQYGARDSPGRYGAVQHKSSTVRVALLDAMAPSTTSPVRCSDQRCPAVPLRGALKLCSAYHVTQLSRAAGHTAPFAIRVPSRVDVHIDLKDNSRALHVSLIAPPTVPPCHTGRPRVKPSCCDVPQWSVVLPESAQGVCRARRTRHSISAFSVQVRRGYEASLSPASVSAPCLELLVASGVKGSP